MMASLFVAITSMGTRINYSLLGIFIVTINARWDLSVDGTSRDDLGESSLYHLIGNRRITRNNEKRDSKTTMAIAERKIAYASHTACERLRNPRSTAKERLSGAADRCASELTYIQTGARKQRRHAKMTDKRSEQHMYI